MRLETSRFGEIDVDEGAILTFTQPIIGFQEFRRFLLIEADDANSVSWLQSVDAGDLAFILMDPRQVVPDYEVKLSKHEMTELAVSSVDELQVFTLVVVPPDRSQVRTNLKAPILINTKLRLGKQTILDKSNYPVQYFLAQNRQEAEESPKEVSNARSNS